MEENHDAKFILKVAQTLAASASRTEGDIGDIGGLNNVGTQLKTNEVLVPSSIIHTNN